MAILNNVSTGIIRSGERESSDLRLDGNLIGYVLADSNVNVTLYAKLFNTDDWRVLHDVDGVLTLALTDQNTVTLSERNLMGFYAMRVVANAPVASDVHVSIITVEV